MSRRTASRPARAGIVWRCFGKACGRPSTPRRFRYNAGRVARRGRLISSSVGPFHDGRTAGSSPTGAADGLATSWPGPRRRSPSGLPSGAGAESALALDLDDPPRQPPAARPRRPQGGGPPGLVRLAGDAHDGLYFDVLRPQDRVAVKPHASPVFHAIQYLLGRQAPREARAVPGVRRGPVLPVADQGPRRRRLLDGLGRAGGGDHPVRLAGAGLPPAQATGAAATSPRAG